MDEQFPQHPFWDFSIATYGRKPVREACLALQERHGADVTIALYCLWRGTRGDVLPATGWKPFLAGVSAWHESIVKPLRAARQAARQAPPALEADLVKHLHNRILHVEIATEHAEQLLIARIGEEHFRAGGNADALSASARNLLAYFRAKGEAAHAPFDGHPLTAFIAAGLECDPGAAAAALGRAAAV